MSRSEFSNGKVFNFSYPYSSNGNFTVWKYLTIISRIPTHTREPTTCCSFRPCLTYTCRRIRCLSALSCCDTGRSWTTSICSTKPTAISSSFFYSSSKTSYCIVCSHPRSMWLTNSSINERVAIEHKSFIIIITPINFDIMYDDSIRDIVVIWLEEII